jgi:hypothetical protein
VFAKVDVESEQTLAANAGIMSIPTLMVFREQVLVFSQPGAPAGRAGNDIVIVDWWASWCGRAACSRRLRVVETRCRPGYSEAGPWALAGQRQHAHTAEVNGRDAPRLRIELR